MDVNIHALPKSKITPYLAPITCFPLSGKPRKTENEIKLMV